MTSIDTKEQAIVVLLESSDNNTKAEKAVNEFTATELNLDGGMERLIAKLYSVLQSETIDEVYENCSKLIDFRKVSLALGKDMKYEDMKSALKRLFNKSSSTTTAQSVGHN